MVLELHVWGPAFGLPSIDAQCLAAIACLQQVVPRGEWHLMASSNPALSPTNELPALRNGNIWIGGFRNIFHYIAQYSGGDWVIDVGLPEQASADCIAFSSFVESHGRPLIDLSLYVSTDNYDTVTRPLFNTIQSFPLPYLTPHGLRTAAKARTAYLNLSSLDVDTAAPPEKSIIPNSLRNPRPSVLTAAPEALASIRLSALATAFLEPLQELRGDKRNFVSDKRFSSLDCLVLGHLSLMLFPTLPQPWLANIMRADFPGLCSWTEALSASVFGPEVTLEDAFLKGPIPSPEELKIIASKGILPWQPPTNLGVAGVSGAFLSSALEALPIVGELRRNTRTRLHSGESEPSSSLQTPLLVIGGVIAGLGLLAGYAFHTGLISLSSQERAEDKVKREFGLDSMGEAGAALGLYAEQMDAQVRIEDAAASGIPP